MPYIISHISLNNVLLHLQSSLHLTPPPTIVLTQPLHQGQANAWRGDQYDRHGSGTVSLIHHYSEMGSKYTPEN